jgi:hypothetical protein
MRGERRGVKLVARVPVGAPQRREILMPVQLPDELFIARHRRVQIVDAPPVDKRRALARHGFKMPVNRLAKTQIAQP